MNEFKTPKEITIVLNGRDGWTIPEIAEVSRMSVDILSSEINFWDEITGKAVAEAVRAIRKRRSAPGRRGE